MINENDQIVQKHWRTFISLSEAYTVFDLCLSDFEALVFFSITLTDSVFEPQIQMTAVCFWHAVRYDRSSSSFISTCYRFWGFPTTSFISWCTLVYQSRVHNWVVTTIRDSLTTVSIIKKNYFMANPPLCFQKHM